MNPVFTLQWPEFVVAERLQKLLPGKEGYSVLLPLSRQEKGIDLSVIRRHKSTQSSVITIQVKASKTHLLPEPKRKNTIRYRYRTWFNRFDVPNQADFIILFGMYAPELNQTRHISATWYRDCSLLFTNAEMCTLIKNCKTVKGKSDKIFGFEFNDLASIILTRGDMNRQQKDFSDFLLDKRINELKKRLKG